MSNRSDRELKALTMKAESTVADAITDAFDLGYDEGYEVAEHNWLIVANKFGCDNPEELEAWYNDMLTKMAEVMNEQELQS